MLLSENLVMHSHTYTLHDVFLGISCLMSSYPYKYCYKWKNKDQVFELDLWNTLAADHRSLSHLPVPCLRSCPRDAGMLTATLGPPAPPALATGLARYPHNWKSPRDGFRFKVHFLHLLGRRSSHAISKQKGRIYSDVCKQDALLAPDMPGTGGAAGTIACLVDMFNVFHTEAQKGTSAACEPFYLFSPLKPFQADFGLDCWLTFFKNFN